MMALLFRAKNLKEANDQHKAISDVVKVSQAQLIFVGMECAVGQTSCNTRQTCPAWNKPTQPRQSLLWYTSLMMKNA